MPEQTTESSSDTLSERVTEELRLAILSGRISPGDKLRVEVLSRQLGYSATPIRESLNRLIAGGMVRATGQRGFRVEPVSYEDLIDLVDMREFVALKALRLSISRGDDAWIAGIRAALECLSRFYTKDRKKSLEGAYEFDVAHKEFHNSLIAACGSPRLLDINNVLNDQAYRYRFLLSKTGPLNRRPDNTHHEQLAELVIARSAKPACAKLREHLSLMMEALDGADTKSMQLKFGQIGVVEPIRKRTTKPVRSGK